MPSIQLSSGPNITQEDVLSLPSPQSPIVNPSGTLAVWPVSTYDFSTYRTEKVLHLVELSKNDGQDFEEPQVLKKGLDNFEAAWLDDSTLVFLRPVLPSDSEVEKDSEGRRIDQGKDTNDEEYEKLKEGWKEKEDGTEVWTLNVETKEEHQVGKLPVSIANIRVAPSFDSKAILAFSATVYPDGSIWNVKSEEAKFKAAKKHSDIRVYNSTFVRRWDVWMPTDGELRQLHYCRLGKSNGDKWAFETEAGKPKIVSPLAGTKLECPVGSFGSAADYSISSNHLLFHSKDPKLNPAFHSRTNIYLASLDSDSSKPQMISVGTQGASGSPILSPDGKTAAFLEMEEDGNEADKNKVMVYDIETEETKELTEQWDRSPARIEWSRDGKKILAIADEHGHVKLFEIALDGSEPKNLTDKHSVSSVDCLENGRLLVSISSFTHPNELYVLDPSSPSTDIPVPKPLSTLTRSLLATKTLHEGESFWFEGAEGHKVQGWLLLPPSHPSCNKDSSSKARPKSYPLIHLTTGGPQGQFSDQWSTRWCANAHAAKGYVTICINRTGSTGFGQDFCDDIREDWAGRPYQDLVAGVKYVTEQYPEVDPERMASSGGSYGGFLQNWIEGHNEDFGFKCIVNFQGIFSTNQIWFSTEELYFTNREFGGAPWEVPETYEKWNPSKPELLKKWKTPMLVIHSSKDYRVVDSEGLGVFNTLQALKIPSRFIVFPSENHWDLTPANNIQWHAEVFRWISEWTKTQEEC
ncbi:hypothetical protein JCM3765_003156 [Sporobolomyces pararoseus]